MSTLLEENINMENDSFKTPISYPIEASNAQAPRKRTRYTEKEYASLAAIVKRVNESSNALKLSINHANRLFIKLFKDSEMDVGTGVVVCMKEEKEEEKEGEKD